jgi:GalNAc-alpha-(1->4)-GalNAc-alpha-(1->3)-diNAcBac-PP-undecaprenol alpha-1,4-N-acetyl-D-galactosaminyltransferase
MSAVSEPIENARIVLVVSGLGAGGTERVAAWLARRYAAAGRRTTIVRLEFEGSPSFYDLGQDVDLVSLGVVGRSSSVVSALIRNVTRLGRLRRAVRRLSPACVISFGAETNVLAILALAGLASVVAADRSNPNVVPTGAIWRLLRRLTYPYAKAVVFQTEAAADALAFDFPRRVVPNPVTVHSIEGGDVVPSRVEIVAMGRLSAEKGFDVLIDALARLPARHGGARLRILGDGPLRRELMARAEHNGVAERVEFVGLVAAPGPWLRAADAFVLPSRYEGYPNALCEAMALGMPVIAADCDFGPRELLRDGEDGVLVPPDDPAALARALGDLLDSPSRRAALGVRAAAIKDRLSEDAVFAAWREAIGARAT